MKNIEQLTQSALLLGIYCIFLILDRITLGAVSVISCICIIPFIIYGIMHDIKPLIIMGITGIIMTIFIAYPTSVFYYISDIVIAIVCSSMMHHKKNKLMIIGTTITISVVVCILSITAFSKLIGIDISSDINDVISITNTFLKPMYEKANMVESYEKLISYRTMHILFSVTEIIYGILQGTIIYIIAKVTNSKVRHISNINGM